MNLAGYIRVSTEGQVDAYGKDVQREAILRWAALNGHLITHFYEEDGVSGKTDSGSRPALSQALEQAERKRFEGIVVFEPSRIARRIVVQETLLSLIWSQGLKVFSTTTGELSEDEDDPTKIMIRQILGVIAEFDHRTTVKKLQAGRIVKSAQGGYIGGTPAFGMTVEGTGRNAKLVTSQVESWVVQDILEMHAEGQSLNGIAKVLNGAGKTTKRGKQWTAVQVSRVIKRNENT
jgi:DNA invertase Pin-like site-specific DNA recombinase